MKITPLTFTLLKLLRAGGLNSHVRGWDRALRMLFPISQQSETFLDVPYRGKRYRAVPSQYVDWQVLCVGAYEIEDLKIFDAVASHKTPLTVLDIGTNVGHHAYVFATLGATVHAFEPNPQLWPIIEAKINMARLTHVYLHKIGLSDRDASLHFYMPDHTNSGTGQFVGKPSAGETITLPVRQGDTYLDEIGAGSIDLIKIDVQGLEPQVLAGLKKTLIRYRPIVSVEIGSENRESIPSIARLASMLPPDYVFHRIAYRHVGLLRFARIAVLPDKDYPNFDGNLFCAPRENEAWLRH